MTAIRMGQCTWVEIEQIAANPNAVGLILIGSLEQHGPHLPLDTDAVLTERMAVAASNRVVEPILWTPVLPFSLSRQHIAFPGTITLETEILEASIFACIAAFRRAKIHRFGLFSAHGGNFHLLASLANKTLRETAQVHIAAYSDFKHFLNVMFEAGAAAGLELPPCDSHAGALETSMASYLGIRPRGDLEAIRGYMGTQPDWLEVLGRDGIQALSPDGVLGYPANMSMIAGERIFEALVCDLAGWLQAQFQLTAVSL